MARTWATWMATVLVLMKSACAISLFALACGDQAQDLELASGQAGRLPIQSDAVTFAKCRDPRRQRPHLQCDSNLLGFIQQRRGFQPIVTIAGIQERARVVMASPGQLRSDSRCAGRRPGRHRNERSHGDAGPPRARAGQGHDLSPRTTGSATTLSNGSRNSSSASGSPARGSRIDTTTPRAHPSVRTAFGMDEGRARTRRAAARARFRAAASFVKRATCASAIAVNAPAVDTGLHVDRPRATVADSHAPPPRVPVSYSRSTRP